MSSPDPTAEAVEPIAHATGSKPDCAHALDHLYEYLDSEMTAEDQLHMRAHLAHCTPCLAELSLEEMVKEIVRRSCHEQAPPHLRMRIQAQVSVWRTTTAPVD